MTVQLLMTHATPASAEKGDVKMEVQQQQQHQLPPLQKQHHHQVNLVNMYAKYVTKSFY
jgi:hypothetical protein